MGGFSRTAFSATSFSVYSFAFNASNLFLPTPWRTYIVTAEVRGMLVPEDPRRALPTTA